MYGYPTRHAYRARPQAHVGGFWGDLGSVLEWPFKTASDAISAVVSVTPGGDWIKRAFDGGATFLADVARWDPGPKPFGLPLGQWVLFTISGNVAPAIASLQVPGGSALVDRIAPILAEMSWAMPAFMAQHGQCFTGAYVQTFTERFVALEKILGTLTGTSTDSLLSDQIASLLNSQEFLALVDPAKIQGVKDAAAAAGQPVPSTANALASVGASPNALAARFHVRADSAALALQLIYCSPVADVRTFDPTTGADPQNPFVRPTTLPASLGSILAASKSAASRLVPIPRLPDGTSADDILLVILQAQNEGEPDWRVADLESQFKAQLAKEQSASSVTLAAKAAAAHGQFAAAPLPGLWQQVGTFVLLTAPLWGTVLYLRRKRA